MDARIVSLFDSLGIYLQKHRGWNLIKVQVWCAFLNLIFGMAHANGAAEAARPFLLGMIGILFGMGLLAEIGRFKRDGDYHESARKTKWLNLEALHHRSYGTVRIVFLGMFVGFVTSDVLLLFVGVGAFWKTAVLTIWYTCIFSAQYLRCCTYLGPGEHSREHNRQTVEQAVPETMQ